MRYLPVILLAACAVLSLLAGPGTVRAQHFDVLVQQMNGKLVSGAANFDNSQWLLGHRVFHRSFDSDYAINNPGWNALGASSPSMPVGAQALPGITDLSWDFLSMTIDNTLSQNLFYWDGQDSDGVPGLTPSDVDFGPLPGANYTLSLFDKFNAKYSVNGANAVVSGGVIDTTASDGSIHRHRFFFLEDGDGNSATVPADGIYLLALKLRMPALAESLPIFMIFGTPGSSVAAEDDAAYPWVLQQINLPGDYNQNGVVDAADYVVWRKTLGQSAAGIAADGDGNGSVGPEDYTYWRSRIGNFSNLRIATGSAAGVVFSPVPEPDGWILIVASAIGALLCGRVRLVIVRLRNDTTFLAGTHTALS